MKEVKKGVQSKVKPYIDDKKGSKKIGSSRNSKVGANALSAHKSSVSGASKFGINRQSFSANKQPQNSNLKSKALAGQGSNQNSKKALKNSPKK